MLDVLLGSAPTGSGKTEAALHQIIQYVNDGDTCIVTSPTIQLNAQCLGRIRELAPDLHVELINGNTHPGRSVHRLSEHLKQPLDKPHIILTTQESFERQPYLVNPGRYRFFCDEIPKAVKSASARIPCNHTDLTEAFDVVQRGSAYGEIIIRDGSKLRSIANNKQGDEINAILQPFAIRVLDPNWQTFVDVKQYEDFLLGRRDDPDLRMFSLLRPCIFAGFKSATLLGARAHETILYKWWDRCGVRFRSDEEILSRLRYREHTNGHLIDFRYLSETNWSFHAQDEHPHLRGRFIEAAREAFKGRRFGWLENKRFEQSSPFNDMDGAEKLPHASHGRNDFQHLDNVVILTAFNYQSQLSNFLQDYAGITTDEQKIAHDGHNTMQTIGRISIRDPSNNNKKIVILSDRQNALRQSDVYPGSSVRSMNVDDRKPKSRGRPATYENATERQRGRRQRLGDEQNALVEKLDLRIQSVSEAGYTSLCHEFPIDTLRNNVTTYQGSIIHEKMKGNSLPLILSDQDFGIYLKGLHRRTIANKDDNKLIMSALCLPVPDGSTQRAELNAIYGRHIILDFDDSELKPLALSRIFPHNEILCFNSYNHTEERLRYRAIFLTDDVMSPATYKFLWYQIVQRIENAGYYGFKDSRPKGERKLHGIDNKPNIVTPFYLPSQPKTGKGFFYHYVKNRKQLCIMDWINNPIMIRFDDDPTSEIITPSIIQYQFGEHKQFIENALDHYRRAITLPNSQTGITVGSNDALFRMALALKGAGVDRTDADTTMTRAANDSNSPRDRIGDKNRYLKKYW